MKPITFFIVIITLLTGCSNDNIKVDKSFIVGDYKFIQYNSSVALDLNFDGAKSVNLLDEFDLFVRRASADLRIVDITQMNGRSSDFIGFLNSFPRMNPNAMFYEMILGLSGDAINFNLDNDLSVIDLVITMTDYPLDGQYFRSTYVELLDNQNFLIVGEQNFYDFETEEWIDVEIEAILEKVTE